MSPPDAASDDLLEILRFNANHVRTVAVAQFRTEREHVAAVVEIVKGESIHLEPRGGFASVDDARAVLQSVAAEGTAATGHAYLVHRP